MKSLASSILKFTTLVSVALILTASAAAEDVYQTAVRATEAYRNALDQLATSADQNGLTDQARVTRDWGKPRETDRVYVARMPEAVGRPKLPDGASAVLNEWHQRFWQLREKQADLLFGLARRAVRMKRASLAFDLAMAAVRENPDHPALRRLMGYQELDGAWRSAYEVRKLRGGQVWDRRFGWVKKAELPKFEKGLRPYRGKWLPAEEVARFREDIRDGWDIETEHYMIRTNHSREAGVALAEKLERLYRVWKQLFVRYYATEAQVASLFDGRNRARGFNLPRHQIVYFRDRDDYNRNLKPTFPNIEQSVGVYVEETSRAYFFANGESDDRTLFHEATHQLFHESRRVAPSVGGKANFWIVEGIATFMESFQTEDDYYVVGGQDDIRFKAARYRLLVDGFYIPLAQLSRFGIRDLQTHPKIATVYSQLAGLTHFLVSYDEGRYRDALVGFLAAVYNGNQDPALLSRLTGVPYAQLDRQYRAFVKKTLQKKSSTSDSPKQNQ